MSSGLLIFRGLTHDAQGGEAGILVTLVCVEHGDELLGSLTDRYRPMYLKETTTARTARRDRRTNLNVVKNQSARTHAPSLRPPRWCSSPVEIKRHHYRLTDFYG
jgi:hypothetical protein